MVLNPELFNSDDDNIYDEDEDEFEEINLGGIKSKK